MCMKKFSAIFFTAVFSFIIANSAWAQDVWVNDARSVFLRNSAMIYGLNLRTFNAQDINGNGLIDFADGEESGNFLNAIERLDELASAGINTIHVLPVMEIGKTKALGTAGSLYAPLSFTKLNPQLGSDKTALPLERQAVKFIDEAHKRRIRVLFDVPCCGSYDLFMKNPELFEKNTSGQAVVPADWTDVRLFKCGTDGNINREVLNLYKDYVDYVIRLGVDGIRADVATNKPERFWKELIDYSRRQDPEFLWLAEASESWNEPVVKNGVFTPYDKLLDAGFDGYYGNFMNFKNMKSSREFTKYIESIIKLKTKYPSGKAVIGSFSTHDELSPILVGGPAYAEMTFWLNAVLPVNFYTVDGIPSGDNFVYFWGNKKAEKTFTDDDYYFVHRGKLDIFNFSRKPGGKNIELQKSFARAVKFKYYAQRIYNSPDFKFNELKCSQPEMFAFTISDSKDTILVIGNHSQKALSDGIVSFPKYSTDVMPVPVQLHSMPEPEKGKIKTNLLPYEIQVIVLNKFEG